jgi:hypothetical protein
MARVLALTLLCGLGLVVFPATAAAQFYPTIAPPNPLYSTPAYRYQFSVGVTVPTVYGRTFVGMTAPATAAPQLFSPNLYSGPTNTYTGPAWRSGNWNYTGAASSGYISGGGIQSDAFAAAQREFEKAQRDASVAALKNTPDAAKDAIYDQWAYEKLGVLGLPSLKDENKPEMLVKALGVTDEKDVASGDMLNHILVAIVAAESKGAKGPSAFLPPQLLDEVRFTGSPAADAFNLIRQASKLPFPDAFDDPKLKEIRNQLERDFAAAAAPLRDGKPAEAAKLQVVSFDLKKAQDAATPVIRNLPFAGATATRRFLNRFETALGAMKGPTAALLVNSAWSTEGASVADIVKHMTKHKMLFGPAPEGSEAAYLALHKALATYLLTLTQQKK